MGKKNFDRESNEFTVYCSVLYIESRPFHAAQISLEFEILLLQLLKCWVYGYTLTYLVPEGI